MELGHSNHDIKAILKYAGAFIAWVVGSGFATGQEILQFFASYGYASYAIILLNLIGFLFLGQTLLTTGYEQKDDETFNHYRYFCGNKLGTAYSWLVPIILMPVMAVLISGSGATLYEYYGISHYIGSALMALMVLGAYLIGFERLVNVVSMVSPVIILFSLFIGVITLFKDFHNITEIGQYGQVLAEKQSSPGWTLSSILYMALTFLGGSTYYTALGASAVNRKSARWGAIIGTVAVILTITFMNTSILLNARDTSALAVPTLYLAKKLSYVLGATFSIVLILGIFSSCSAMMWTVCNRFTKEGTKNSKIFATALATGAFLLGLLPFSELVGVFYPFIGYIGLAFIGCVVYKGLKKRTKSSAADPD